MKNTLRQSYELAGLGLCLAGALGTANSSYGAEEQSEKTPKFELNIVASATGSDQILARDFAGGVAQIQSSLSLDSEYARATNLCAALTAQGQFNTAKKYCEVALSLSRSARYQQQISIGRHFSARTRHAMALNNLGVWHALQGNNESARTYFKTARNRGKQAGGASDRNLYALRQREDIRVAIAS